MQAFGPIFTKALKAHSTKRLNVKSVAPSHLALKNPERNKLWVALNADGCVVGFPAFLKMNFSMAGLRLSSTSSYEIQKLAVAKNYRRQGISELLWKELEREGNALCPDRTF